MYVYACVCVCHKLNEDRQVNEQSEFCKNTALQSEENANEALLSLAGVRKEVTENKNSIEKQNEEVLHI